MKYYVVTIFNNEPWFILSFRSRLSAIRQITSLLTKGWSMDEILTNSKDERPIPPKSA